MAGLCGGKGGALAGGLERVRETDAHVEKAYVSKAEAQRTRDLVKLLGLTPTAWAALRAVEQAKEKAEREAMSRAGVTCVDGPLAPGGRPHT